MILASENWMEVNDFVPKAFNECSQTFCKALVIDTIVEKLRAAAYCIKPTVAAYRSRIYSFGFLKTYVLAGD